MKEKTKFEVAAEYIRSRGRMLDMERLADRKLLLRVTDLMFPSLKRAEA